MIGLFSAGLLHRALRDAAAARGMRLDLRSFWLCHLIVYVILLTTAVTAGTLLASEFGWFSMAGGAFRLDRRTRELERTFAPVAEEEEP